MISCSIKLPEEEEKFFDVKWADCNWEQNSSLMVILSDVTHTHKANYDKELIKLSEYKDELLATVSHDLKTPLGGMMMTLQSLYNDG